MKITHQQDDRDAKNKPKKRQGREQFPVLVCLLGFHNSTLPGAYDIGIIVCMRTTLNIDDDLLAEARKFTGEIEKTALVHLGLRALIEREAGKRLARLGATMPKLRVASRRR